MHVILTRKGTGAFQSTATYDVDEKAFNDLLDDGLSEVEALNSLRSDSNQKVETIGYDNELTDIHEVDEESVEIDATLTDYQLAENTNPYYVTLKVNIGDIEKRIKRFELAESEEAAGIQAMEGEAHGELDWNEDKSGAFDMNGELHYSITSVREVPLHTYLQMEILDNPDADLSRRSTCISIG